MKSMRTLLVAALAAAGLATAGSAFAQHNGGHSGGHFSGGHFNGGHFGGGHFVGHGGHFFGPRFSFFLGVPLFWGPYYWGAPYYSPYYSPYYDGYYYGYPDAPTVYQEREVVPYDTMPPTTQAQPGPGAPSQGPLYMNYCASAKAYYPKVTQCPEGWKFIEPSR
jgi:hypothetical protein